LQFLPFSASFFFLPCKSEVWTLSICGFSDTNLSYGIVELFDARISIVFSSVAADDTPLRRAPLTSVNWKFIRERVLSSSFENFHVSIVLRALLFASGWYAPLVLKFSFSFLTGALKYFNLLAPRIIV